MKARKAARTESALAARVRQAVRLLGMPADPVAITSDPLNLTITITFTTYQADDFAARMATVARAARDAGGVRTESPITCAGCVRHRRRNTLARPCGVHGCECYCNR